MTRQIEVPGTERAKVHKKVIEKADEHRSAINSHTRAAVKRRDTKLSLIATMREHGVKEYVDTEAAPPIHVKLTAEDKVTIKAWKEKAEKEEKPKAEA